MKIATSANGTASGIAFTLLLLVMPTSILAQQPAESPSTILLDGEALKEQLTAACDEYDLPAIWAGRFRVDDRPAIVEVAGVRKWGDPELAEVDDVVHLGSCTKAITAVIIAQLCTEGKLRLDTTLGEVFSEMTCVTESEWRNVTIHQLLQHRSGAFANFFAYQLFDQKHPDSVVAARRALLEAVCKRKRPREPKYVYSNVGFILLGHVAEHLEGKPWEQLATELLFEPLGMKSAGFGPVGKPDEPAENAGIPSSQAGAEPNRAWGHVPALDLFSAANTLLGRRTTPSYTPLQIDNSRCLGPAGRVHMNLRDWSHFVLTFARDDGYRTLKISAELWTEMLTPNTEAASGESYAAGWIVFDQPAYKGRAYFHNGSNTTWYSYALAMPGKQECILVATNVFTDASRKACDEIARSINAAE